MWDRRRGEVWYAKYRVGASRQVQKRLGPAWTERGRPPAGYFIKRTADDWLRHTLDEARRGTLAGMVQTGATFADVGGALTTPKSGNVRSVPMAPRVAETLAQLGQRHFATGDDDIVFVGELGQYVDGSALRRRYRAALDRAGLRPLRCHDLRHTFGTRMIAKAGIRRVQEWMGHADVQTTMKYLHYAPRADDARLVAEAFAEEPIADVPARSA